MSYRNVCDKCLQPIEIGQPFVQMTIQTATAPGGYSQPRRDRQKDFCLTCVKPLITGLPGFETDEKKKSKGKATAKKSSRRTTAAVDFDDDFGEE